MHRLRYAFSSQVRNSCTARSIAAAHMTKQAARRRATFSGAARVPSSAAYGTPARRALSTVTRQQESPPRLFGFPFGLLEHEVMIANYRATLEERSGQISAATEALAELQATLRTEAHALELEAALQGKTGKQRSASTEATIELASRTELWSADVQSIVAELTVEQVNKTWVVHALASAASSHIAGVRFESNWSTSLHSIRRELAPHAFHAKLTATPFTITAADNKQDNAVVTDQPSMLLLDVNESDRSRVDAAAIDSLRQSLAPSMLPRDFAWFVSFIATHPTDLAFDVFSECLLREEKQSKSNKK